MQPHYTSESNTIPNTSGIYRIVCTVTSKIYLGSAVNLYRRKHGHFSKLRHNTHHSVSLQRAWDKYGPDAFVFEIVELVLPPFLIEREQYWFDKLKPFGHNGYNINPTAGSRLGTKQTPESIEKTRAANLGSTGYWKDKERPLETREKLRLANLGNKQSEETKRKISKTTKGKTYTPETREKLRISAQSQMRTMIFISPDGTEYIAQGISHFAREHNLDRNHLIDVAQGKRSHHKGWKARYPDTDIN